MFIEVTVSAYKICSVIIQETVVLNERPQVSNKNKKYVILYFCCVAYLRSYICHVYQ
jgi:hypothetical protein